MAVAVDDREDVWANAKDNTSSTVKGEPPANLLHVRPYHWERFQGMKDINNASGQDPSSSCAGNDHSDPNKESDPSLLWIEDILERLYDRFYGQSMVETDAKTVPDILKQMRQEVFATKRLVLSGLIPRHGIELFKEGGPRPTIVRWAQDLGAEVRRATIRSPDVDLSFLYLYRAVGIDPHSHQR
jgi:RNA polymerase II subunit A-like phosphatase